MTRERKAAQCTLPFALVELHPGVDAISAPLTQARKHVLPSALLAHRRLDLGQRLLQLRHALELIELDTLDLCEATRDLITGDAHVFGVFVRLANMVRELFHALVEAAEFATQLGE